MVYEGELAAVWGHIFVQSGRAGDPAHLCPHLFAMVYEGELAAGWGHLFVQSGRAGDPAEACPTHAAQPSGNGQSPGTGGPRGYPGLSYFGLSTEAITPGRSPVLKGFWRKARNRLAPTTRSASLSPKPLMNTTFTSCRCSCRAASTALPLLPGMDMSSRTTSIRFGSSPKTRSASSPSPATSTR